MSENILIFIISAVASSAMTIIIVSVKFGQISEKIKILDNLDSEINQLENSILEITAKLDLISQSSQHDFNVISERVTNLKNNVKSKIQDIKYTQNELISYIQKELHPQRGFIPRSRSKETISEFDEDSWTQLHD
jgi:biopolymer transport protein ExbB/TolQ